MLKIQTGLFDHGDRVKKKMAEIARHQYFSSYRITLILGRHVPVDWVQLSYCVVSSKHDDGALDWCT